MLNPGSVGQPRDDDPRAAYALLDTENLTWQFGRVSYPIEETQQQMRQAGIPERPDRASIPGLVALRHHPGKIFPETGDSLLAELGQIVSGIVVWERTMTTKAQR